MTESPEDRRKRRIGTSGFVAKMHRDAQIETNRLDAAKGKEFRRRPEKVDPDKPVMYWVKGK